MRWTAVVPPGMRGYHPVQSISMPGLILHTSNQLDLLAERLSRVVSTPLDSPFTPEIVVVQSLASRRWLSFKMASLQGICANYAFPFLANFVSGNRGTGLSGRSIGGQDVARRSHVENRFASPVVSRAERVCLRRHVSARRRSVEAFPSGREAGQSLRPIPRLPAGDGGRLGGAKPESDW